jgi:hypothetical protein
MPNYQVSVKYTKADGNQETTAPVPGMHLFVLPDAKEPAHQRVKVVTHPSQANPSDPLLDVVIELQP